MFRIRKSTVIGAGLVCCVVSFVGVSMLVERSSWRRTEGQIVAVRLECEMKARQGKLIYEASVPCEMAGAFKAVNADKDWTATEAFHSSIRFTSADGTTAETELKLYHNAGWTPAIGGALPIQQNPKDPSEVERADNLGTQLFVVVGAGLLGASLLAFAFFTRGGARKRPAPAFDEAADEHQRAARADAMIAAALARQKSGTPEPSAARMGAARSALPRDGGGGFGRRR